jgi:serine/threonine-protein kinase HipA
MDGQEVSNARIETTYKGNYHLFATIDNRELKYIIRKGTNEYNAITATGMTNITENDMKVLVEKYLILKVKRKK